MSDKVQQVMVPQSAKELTDGVRAVPAEMVERGVKLNMSSIKPVLTLTTTPVNGHASSITITNRGPSGLSNVAILPSSAPSGNRRKRKRTKKGVQKKALASPRKSDSDRSTKKSKVEAIPQVQSPKSTLISTTPTTTTSLDNNSSPNLKIVEVRSLAPFGEGASTVTPQPVVLSPSSLPVQCSSRSSFLLPDDVVSDSEDDREGPPIRKCVVCLRRRRFTTDIFCRNSEMGGNKGKHSLLPYENVLIKQLSIPVEGKPDEVGICPSCVDSLQRWHKFHSTIATRHEEVKASGAPFFDSPLNCEYDEARKYSIFRKMCKMKEVYRGATHTYLTRRNLTEKDWKFFCERLFCVDLARSDRARELEKYIMGREKLTHIFCVKCQKLVKNGKKRFVKHMISHHPQETILFPCDICGNHFPEKDGSANSEEYYTHWISHFYFNSCDECGKRFPTKTTLDNHYDTAHKNSSYQWNTKSEVGSSTEDRPWQCDQCFKSFEVNEALVAHGDMDHYKLKNHVCNLCGERFESASSLRVHDQDHMY